MDTFRLRTNNYVELVDFKIWCISNHPELLSKLVNPFDMNKYEFVRIQKSLSRDKFKNVKKRYRMYVAPYKTTQEAIAAFKNVSGNSQTSEGFIQSLIDDYKAFQSNTMPKPAVIIANFEKQDLELLKECQMDFVKAFVEMAETTKSIVFEVEEGERKEQRGLFDFFKPKK